jgi:pimeloyl-ACP methyl ester carboxylesterase
MPPVPADRAVPEEGAVTDHRDVGLVLLHGAELGGWIWDRVLPHLHHPAIAADLPGRGRRPAQGRSVSLDDAVAAVVEDAEGLAVDRLVLVGHSASGVVVPPAVAQLGDRVAAAVFVGATVPVEGRSWADLQPLPARVVFGLLARVRPDGARSPAAQNRTTLCHDLDDEATAAVLERRVAEPPRVLLDPVSPAALPPGVATHVVRLTDDRAVPEAVRDASEARLPGATRHDLASGHLPMLSLPEELAALLSGVADSAGREPSEVPPPPT